MLFAETKVKECNKQQSDPAMEITRFPAGHIWMVPLLPIHQGWNYIEYYG